jgi:metallophosphoesterase superfamily enzyme
VIWPHRQLAVSVFPARVLSYGVGILLIRHPAHSPLSWTFRHFLKREDISQKENAEVLIFPAVNALSAGTWHNYAFIKKYYKCIYFNHYWHATCSYNAPVSSGSIISR